MLLDPQDTPKDNLLDIPKIKISQRKPQDILNISQRWRSGLVLPLLKDLEQFETLESKCVAGWDGWMECWMEWSGWNGSEQL